MPEEANTNTQTTTPAAEPANTAASEPAATQTSATTEPAKSQEPASAEPELTVDSYKDLGLDQFADEFHFAEDGLKAFKELGVKNKISPEAMKALSIWSMSEIKRQKEEFAKTQEEWRAENAKKYGENLKNVQTNVGRVLAQIDKSGNFANLLKAAGAEEHPATLEFLSAIGDIVLEKGSINPNATIQGKEMSLEDMYRSKN